MLPREILLTISLSVIALVQVCQGQEVTIHRSSNILVTPGTNVTITCRMQGFTGEIDFKFAKGAYDNFMATKITEDISTLHILSDLYKRLGRFGVTKGTEGEDTIYTLTITGVTYQDTGFYACLAEHPTLATVFKVAKLEVYQPPTNITHNFNTTQLDLFENDPINMNCTVLGVIPLPTIGVYIEDNSGESVNPLLSRTALQPWRNLTSQFQSVKEFRAHCLENPSLKPSCPLYFNYDISAVTNNLRAQPDFDGKKLTCGMYITEFDFSINTSVVINVIFKPKVMCDKMTGGTISAKLNQTGFVVSCSVTANPVLMDGSSWIDGSCTSNNVIGNSDEYTTTDQPVSEDGKRRFMELRFSKVLSAKYFNKKYCLRVSNQQGQTHTEFTLKYGSTAGGVQLMSSGLLHLATLLLALAASYIRG